MIEKINGVLSTELLHRQIALYPVPLLNAVLGAAQSLCVPLYISGGALRDWLLGNYSSDLDFTISQGATAFLQKVQSLYGAGTIVSLGTRHDDTCRFVAGNLTIDVTGFRNNSTSIEEDLERRDFTINALAAAAQEVLAGESDITIIDPMSGIADMELGLLRACPGAFQDDPLRMLRAFRFSAILGYSIEAETFEKIADETHLIKQSAAERIRHECDMVMVSPRAHEAIAQMAEVGLLKYITPELYEGDGVDQPAFHHLDVLQHNLQTLSCMELIISNPARYYPDNTSVISDYLADQTNVMLLKWAALFHDVGKPATRQLLPEKDNRITFYGHDEEGARKFLEFALRLKWSKVNRGRVCSLISMHMHPFHLCNVLRSTGNLSSRARIKVCRKAGDELPGLFLLAMADSLAGQGVDKPEGIEGMLATLYGELETMYREEVAPRLQGPKLLTGHDLIATVGLEPGPRFREILSALDIAIVEGTVESRDEALSWVDAYMSGEV